jgi:RNA polymerase subunit RPABC4/transcription elongation factor Spt4
MCIFIGGIQPRTITVDDTRRLCPACGLAQARLKRIDHYLSVFFIPLIPVKRGPVMLVCDRCAGVFDPDQPMLPSERRNGASRTGVCRHCGQPLDPAFSYCPYCGRRV